MFGPGGNPLLSRDQLYLAAVVVLMILLALPAFVLEPSGGTSGASTSERESVLASVSVPSTEINLDRTTEDEREQIRFERKININTAGASKLQSLPDVGPNRAEDIVAYREDGNVFRNYRDLYEIEGFGSATVKKLKPHVHYGKDNYQKPSSGGAGKTLNVNEASADQLQTLDGVGTVTAGRMIDYREENGPFRRAEDLKAVSGLGDKTVENFLDQIEDLPGGSGGSDSSSGGSVNVNDADLEELETLPGIGPVTAEAIAEYRETNGDFSSLDDLDNVSGIGSATIDNLRSRATVN
jgi:competence ComEA-like helix-hairpin-helix protein